MVDEVLRAFEGIVLKSFYEGTLGAGGHAKAILKAHPEIERYIGCDRDPEAIEIARAELDPWKEKVEFVHGNFSDLDLQLREKGIETVDGFFLIWESHQCS
ncbi:MAG: Ribosomal RNA small subunit methyltransferase H [Chlamydiae bacterium]|nr:Ribosomal RNA small subunit methyltransferase H [Chlamydiota bacterium]